MLVSFAGAEWVLPQCPEFAGMNSERMDEEKKMKNDYMPTQCTNASSDILLGHFYMSGVLIGQRTRQEIPVRFREISPL